MAHHSFVSFSLGLAAGAVMTVVVIGRDPSGPVPLQDSQRAAMDATSKGSAWRPSRTQVPIDVAAQVEPVPMPILAGVEPAEGTRQSGLDADAPSPEDIAIRRAKRAHNARLAEIAMAMPRAIEFECDSSSIQRQPTDTRLELTEPAYQDMVVAWAVSIDEMLLFSRNAEIGDEEVEDIKQRCPFKSHCFVASRQAVAEFLARTVRRSLERLRDFQELRKRIRAASAEETSSTMGE